MDPRAWFNRRWPARLPGRWARSVSALLWLGGPALVLLSLLATLDTTRPLRAAEVIDTATLRNIDAEVQISLSGFRLNRATGTYLATAVIANVSAHSLAAPIYLVVSAVSPPGSSVVEAHGLTTDGKPYYDLTGALVGGTLMPGASTNPLPLQMKSTASTPIQLGLNVYVRVPNHPPVADAGPDQTAFVGDTVHFDGSGSSDLDGDPLTYFWSLRSVPPGSGAILTDPQAVNPSLTLTAPGDYVGELVVNDGLADSAPDSITISTENSPPVANAGPDQTAFVGDTLTLDASASSDADGDALTFHWSLTHAPPGSGAALSDPNAVNPTLKLDLPGSYAVTLVVNDGALDSAPDTVALSTENSAPVARAGVDRSAFVGDTVALDGTASSDVDGDPLTYRWSLASTPLGSAAALTEPTAPTPSFVLDKSGTYIAQLIVNDGALDSLPDTVASTTENSRPLAHAGPDQTLLVGATVFLDGSLSTDADGDPLTFAWSLIGSPPDSGAVLSEPHAERPTFTIDLPGDYTVQLVVNDGTRASDPDTVTITTENSRPVADAGPDQTLVVNDIALLDGGASFDADGDPLAFLWSLIAQPVGSTATLTGATTATPSFLVDRAGTYVAQLIVNDHALASAPDTVTLTTENHAPFITSAPSKFATTGAPYSYEVEALDPDGDDLIFSLTTGPPGMTIDPASGRVEWTPGSADVGDHEVTVRVADPADAFALQTFTLTVSMGVPTNHPPAITSAPPLTATAGSPYTYAVEATDPDTGDVLTYALDGAPAGMTIDPVTGLIAWTPTIAQVGDQSVTLRVADSGGLFDTQAFTVVVSAPVNRPPSITSTPIEVATVAALYRYDVDAADPDAGDILTFALTLAPEGMSIDAASGLIQWTPAANQVGPNLVTLRVTDSAGAFAEQAYSVRVSTRINRPPIAVDDAFAVENNPPSNRIIDLAFDRLPSAQGWTFTTNNSLQDAAESQVFFVCTADGVQGLCMDSTSDPFSSNDGNAFSYTRQDLDLTQPFTVLLRARMLEEKFHGIPSRRNAFGLYVAAATGTENFTAGIGANPPRIQTSANDFAEVPTIFDTRQWHDYRLEVTPGVGFKLFVDGETTPLITGPGSASSALEALEFGDGTSFNAVRAEITRLTVILAPPSQVVDLAFDRLPSTQGWKFNTNNSKLGISEEQIFSLCEATHALCLNSLAVPFDNNDGSAFWYSRKDVDLSRPYTLLMRARVLQEVRGGNPSRRNAFGLYVGAVTGSTELAAGIGASPNRIQTYANDFEEIPTSFDTTQWHDYRLEVTPSVGFQLFVDEQPVPLVTSPLAPGNRSNMPGLSFGDGTSFNAVLAEISRLTFISTPPLVANVLPNDSDPDGDVLSAKLVTSPSHGTLDLQAKGSFSYVPAPEFFGTDTFTYRASDGQLDSNTATVTITVTQPNRPPVITSAPVTVATQDMAYTYDVDATDPDPGDTLTYSLTTQPAGMSINPSTGLIEWPPTAGQVGMQQVAVTVQDQGGLFATQSFFVNVTAIENQPPSIDSTPVSLAAVGQPYTYDVDATDPDPGDTLTYSLDTAPPGMTIDAATGGIAWTPTVGQLGSNPVAVRVTDNHGAFATQPFSVTVGASNAPPVAVAGLLNAPELPGCVAPPGGLVTWYAGDGSLADIVGPNSPNATIGSPQFVPGKVGQGIKFDGSSGLIAPNDPSINFGRNDSFAIDAWVQVNGQGGDNADNSVVDKLGRRLDGTNGGYALDVLHSPFTPAGTWAFGFVALQDHDKHIFERVGTKPVAYGEFHFVAATVDRATQTISIYLDGVLQQELDFSHVGDLLTSSRLFIGHQNLDWPYANPVRALNGVLDEAEIFNRALTQSEIQSLFLAGSAGKCKLRVGDTVRLDGTRSSDPDADPLSYHWTLLAKPAGSTSALDDANAFQPTFVADLQGTYRLQLIVNDGVADSAPSEISIAVIEGNRPSIALDDSYTSRLGETLVVPAPGVTANDHDPDGNPLAAAELTDPSNGSLEFSVDGSFSYTPNPNVFGPGASAHTLIGTTFMPGPPNSIEVNQAANRIYVTNLLASNLAVIDGTTGKVIAQPITNRSHIEDVALNPATNRLYVTGTQINNYFSSPALYNEVTVIDGATNTKIAAVPVGAQPRALAVNAVTNRIFVANVADNTVSVIDGATPSLILTLPVGREPQQIRVDSQLNHTYALSTLDASVTVIDGATNAVVTTVPVGAGAAFMLVDPEFARLYVANGEAGTVSVIDTLTNSVIDTIAVGVQPAAIALHPALDRFYVTNAGGNSVTVIDRDSRAVLGTIPVGAAPQSVTVNPFSNSVYVANAGGNTVSVIDAGTNTVTATVPVGGDPRSLLVNPFTDRVYTLDAASHTVSVIHVGDRFTYKVTDGASDSNAATVTVVIEPQGVPPVAASDRYTAAAGSTLNVSAPGVLANDADVQGNPLTAEIVSPPSVGTLSLNPDGGFSFVVPADFSGPVTFAYKATNGTTASNVATVTILPEAAANQPPTITSSPVTTATVGQPYVYDVDATDPDAGDTLTYSLTTQPAGMSINSATGLIGWTPMAEQVGLHSVSVKVEDQGGLFATQAYIVTVTAPENHPPSIDSTPVFVATVAQPYRYDVVATDPDAGDTLTYSLDSAPPGMTIDAFTGLIAWTPTVEQLGPHSVAVRATDNSGAFATQSYTVTVAAEAVPPTITSTPPLTATVAQPYFYAVEATDPNPGDTLTYALATQPAGMTIDAATGFIAWTPTAAQIGPHAVSVKVSDPGGLFAEQGYTVIVSDAPPPNQAPDFTSVPLATATVGEIYSYDADATDPDGDPLTFSLDTSPAGMAIVPSSGLLTWTPAADQIGPNPVVVHVSDGRGGHATQGFTVQVAAPNQPPAITSTAVTAGTVGEPYSYPVTATDPDAGDTLSFALDTAPAGMAIGPATGLIAWIPAANQIGPHAVTVRVTDNHGASGTQAFTVTVAPASGDPIVSITVLPGSATTVTGNDQSFQAFGIRGNGSSIDITDAVIWESTNPAVATVNSAGVVSAIAAGTTTIRATQGSITATVTVIVEPAQANPTPPTAAITAPADQTVITSPVAVTGTASDPEFLKYRLEIAPVGTSEFTLLTESTTPVTDGVLGTLDPTGLINDQYTLRLTVLDRGNNAASTELQVQVSREQKVGNFTLAFQDVSVPTACLPVTVTRVYDSREKRVGDFGVGWRLDVQTLRLRDNRLQGDTWHVDLIDKPGPFGILIPTYVLIEDAVHKVSLTLPDGHVEEFDLRPSPTESPFTPIQEVTVDYVPRNGTLGALQVEGGNPTLFLTSEQGDVEFLDSEATVFDPQRFRYTSPEGNEFVIQKHGAVEEVQCTNGTKLVYGPGGITHDSGTGVGFTRDTQGRVTQVADPMGHAHQYSYDANGDLESHTDPEGNVTRFVYNLRHELLEIRDPRGVRAIRNEYDDSGRLISSTDPGGKATTFEHDLVARTESVTDRLDNVTVYKYDDKGNVLEQIDALGHSTTFEYDDVGNETKRTDALGQVTLREYDTRRNVLEETDPLEHTTRYTYTALNAVRTITDPLNRITTNTYDPKGNLLTTTDPLGGVTTHTYDTGGAITPGTGNLLSTKDALEETTTYEYNSAGYLTEETDPLGNVTTYSYDANGNRLTETRPGTVNGAPATLITHIEYDDLNRLTKTTFPDGSSARTIYNEIGKQAETIDQLDRSTTYEYDALGRLSKTTYPDDTFETSSYDPEGRRLTSTDRAGRTTSYTYDETGRLLTTTYSDGTSTATAYDEVGQVESTTDARGNVTKYTYDAAGRRKAVEDALGHVTTFSYDDAGNQTEVTDANGNTLMFTFDANNRRTRTTYPDTTFETSGYDLLGRQIAKIDQAGLTTQFGYDALGRLEQVTDALAQVTSYTYDARGNQLTQTDAEGHTTQFQYDALGRRTKRILPLGEAERFTYDAAGNVATKIDFNGRTTTFAYDEVNRLKSRTPDPALTEPAVSYTYTPTGQRASMMDASGTTTYDYDVRDRLIEKATPQGTLTYDYDLAGNLLSITSSNPGGAAMSYAYDTLNRLMTVTDTHGDTTYTYDDVGNLKSFATPNGVTHTYTYNTLNRLTDVTAATTTGTLAQFTYTLGASGNRTGVTELSGRTVTYGYDDLYRLTQEKIANDPAGATNGQIDYDYDKVGNRLTRTSTVAGIDNQSFTYDANDRLGTDTYDDNGNTTGSGGKSYGYDFENRLVGLNGSEVRIAYDGDGNRVRKTVGAEVTEFLVDDRNPTGYAQVLNEIVNGVVARRYTYGHDLLAQEQAEGVSWYGYDGHGSAQMMTDVFGAVTDEYTYDAFGNLIAQSGSTPNIYRYSGEQRDHDLGRDYLRARYLNVHTGRFTSIDLIDGSNLNPRGLHRYTYTANDPVNGIDPTGLITLVEVSYATAIQNQLSVFSLTRGYIKAGIQALVSHQQIRSCFIEPGNHLRSCAISAIANGIDDSATRGLYDEGDKLIRKGHRLLAESFKEFAIDFATELLPTKISLDRIRTEYNLILANFPQVLISGSIQTFSLHPQRMIEAYRLLEDETEYANEYIENSISEPSIRRKCTVWTASAAAINFIVVFIP